MEDYAENKVVRMKKYNVENEQASERFNIQRTCLKHILLALTVIGCYDYSKHDRKRKCVGCILVVYRIFICLVLFAFMAKTATGFAYIQSADYTGQAIVLAWIVCSLITFLLSLRMNHTVYGNQERTLEFWNTNIIPQMVKLGIKFDCGNFRRKQILVCCIATFILILLILFCCLQLSGVLGGGNTGISTIPFEQTLLTNILQAVLLTVCSMQAIVPLFYLIVICHMLYLAYKSFNEFLESQMCEAACQLPHAMQTIREYYISLCKVVKDFDKDFKYFFGNYIFWNISSGLFILYVLLRTDMNSYGIIGLISYIFWLCLSLGSVLTMSVAAAFVHESVRQF